MAEAAENPERAVQDLPGIEGLADGHQVGERSLDPNDFPQPEYIGKDNESMRQKILRETKVNDSNLVRLFEVLCDYVQKYNNGSGLIPVENFCTYTEAEGSIRTEFGGANKINSLLQKLADELGEKTVGIFEIIRVNKEGLITHVALYDMGSDLQILYKKIERICLQNFKDVKAKRKRFRSFADIEQEFNLYKSELASFVITVSVEDLDQDAIHQLSEKKDKLIVIDLKHDVGTIVVPSNQINNLILLFISLVDDYYQDNTNDNLRQLIQRRLEKQKLNIGMLISIFRQAKLRDPYFLFFSQLFYTIMNNLSEKFRTQNFVNNEVINQLIASRFLTVLSFNLRQEVRDEQASEEQREEFLKTTIRTLITDGINKGGTKIYYPVVLDVLLNVEVEVKSSDGKGVEKKEIRELFSPEEVKGYIAKVNAGRDTIPEVISFPVAEKHYYVHRCRVIQSFISMIELERASIKSKILGVWTSDPSIIPKRHDYEAFAEKVESEYCSQLFTAYLSTLVELLSASSPVSGKPFDSSYFVTRFFFDEREGSPYVNDVDDLVYLSSDFGRKKKILKAFFNTIFDSNYESRSVHEILKVSFLTLRKQAYRQAGIGGFSRFVRVLSEFFSALISMFDANKAYVKEVSKSLTPLLALKAKKRFTDEKDKEVQERADRDAARVSSAEKGGATAQSRERSVKSSAESGKEQILKNFPILKDSGKINGVLEELASKWNYKIGEARNDFQESVDGRIRELAARFDASAFEKDGIDEVVSRFIAGNKKIMGEIVDKKAFKEYVFYKAALFKVGH